MDSLDKLKIFVEKIVVEHIEMHFCLYSEFEIVFPEFQFNDK